MASHARRDRVNAIQTQPARWATTVDTERRRVVLRNVRGIIKVFTYREEPRRVVFHEVEDRIAEDYEY